MRQILTLVLVLTLLIPFISSAQSLSCIVNYRPDGVHYNDYVDFRAINNCATPKSDLSNVNISSTGFYTCNGKGSNTSYTSSFVTDSFGPIVRVDLKCPVNENIGGTFILTVKFGVPSGGTGGGTTDPSPGYYCNKTDPVKPYCDQWTSTSQGQSIPYMQCMTSCQPSRNWVDIKINSEPGFSLKDIKYLTGQIIKFLPESNILGSLTKFNWDLGDNILRSGEPYREQPVVYSTPGKKTIKLSVVDPKSGKTIATSTEIKVKCVPPSGATDDITTIQTFLNNNRTVKVSANNLRSFVDDNKQDVSNSLNYCQLNLGAGDQNPISLVNATKIIDYYSIYSHQRKMATPLALAIVTDLDPTIIGLPNLPPTNPIFSKVGRYQPIAFHAEVALDFWADNSQGTPIYKIKTIDPNGPTLSTLNCEQKQIKSGPSTFQPILICDFDYVESILTQLNIQSLTPAQLRDVKNSFKWLIYDPNITDVTPIDVNLLASKAVRKNTAKYLEDNYFLIDNGDPQFGGGVCAAWSTLAIKAAYLADFVGECASTPTAEVPRDNNTNLASTGLLEFLNSLFNQLLRPILTN